MIIEIILAVHLLLTCACLVILLSRGKRTSTVELTGALNDTQAKMSETLMKMNESLAIMTDTHKNFLEEEARHSQNIIETLEKHGEQQDKHLAALGQQIQKLRVNEDGELVKSSNGEGG